MSATGVKPTYGRVPPPRLTKPVPGGWRYAAVVLAVLVVVLLILPWALAHTVTRSQAEWFHFSVIEGPGAPLGSNFTEIRPNTFCAPSDAVSVGLFSMTWTASGGIRVTDVRLWTPDPDLPFPNILYLYHGYNESSGGTSFESPYPVPCGNMWVLDVDSPVSVTISAVMTLAYNYTATVSSFSFL